MVERSGRLVKFILDLPYCGTYTNERELYLNIKRYKACFPMNETVNISNLDFKAWAILIPCGLIALFGTYKILRQSISLIFWIALVVVGALGVGYVLKPDVTRQVVSKIKTGDVKNLISDEHESAPHTQQ